MPLCSCGNYFSVRKHASCPQCGKPLEGSSNQYTKEQKVDSNLSFGMPKPSSSLHNISHKTTRRPCPHCSEMVMATANICPLCNQAILSFDPSKNAAQTLILWIIMFPILFFGLQFCAMWHTENVTMPWAEKEAEKLMREAEEDADRMMRQYKNY